MEQKWNKLRTYCSFSPLDLFHAPQDLPHPPPDPPPHFPSGLDTLLIFFFEIVGEKVYIGRIGEDGEDGEDTWHTKTKKMFMYRLHRG